MRGDVCLTQGCAVLQVEDRRAEMERHLISMKVQYQSLQKQHAFSRQQLHRMKVQISASNLTSLD